VAEEEEAHPCRSADYGRVQEFGVSIALSFRDKSRGLIFLYRYDIPVGPGTLKGCDIVTQGDSLMQEILLTTDKSDICGLN
jgi:hypothetical protein